MLEIPESKIVAQQMNDTLTGREIERVIMNQSEHRFAFYSMSPDLYPERMEGLIVRGCKSYGGMIAMNLGEQQLYFSDGAYPRYIKPGTKISGFGEWCASGHLISSKDSSKTPLGFDQ